MQLSLRTYHLPHLAPEVLWRWMLLAISVTVFGLLCYIMLLAAGGRGSTLIAGISAFRHWAG